MDRPEKRPPPTELLFHISRHIASILVCFKIEPLSLHLLQFVDKSCEFFIVKISPTILYISLRLAEAYATAGAGFLFQLVEIAFTSYYLVTSFEHMLFLRRYGKTGY